MFVIGIQVKTVFFILIILYVCQIYLVADDSHVWKHEESATQDQKRQIPYADENSDLLELPLPVPIPIHKTQKSEKKASESEDEKIAQEE